MPARKSVTTTATETSTPEESVMTASAETSATETTSTETTSTESEAAKRTRKHVDVSVISLDDLEAASDSFEEEETVEVLSNRERSAAQIAMDGKVSNAYKAWIYGGKPDDMRKALASKLTAEQKTELGVKGVVQRFYVTPENVDAYRTLLDNAGRFLKLQVKRYPVQPDASGRDMLPFIVRDKRDYKPRAKKDGKTTATDATATATE